MASTLQQNRPIYIFTCGVCGREIWGKSNTVHLGVRSHVAMEYRQGKRLKPHASPREHGDKGRKLA